MGGLSMIHEPFEARQGSHLRVRVKRVSHPEVPRLRGLEGPSVT
jgi:hypothetical protein